MNITKSNEPSYWKERYATLLDEHEQLKLERQDSEKLLSRVITRVTTAVSGLDELVDPYLTRIRDLLRKGVPTDALKSELDGISETLFRAVKERSRPNQGQQAGQLFRFLRHRLSSEQAHDSLAAVQKRALSGEFGDETALFRALEVPLQTMVHGQPAATAVEGDRPGIFNRLFGRSGEKKNEGDIDLSAIRKNLIALLDTGALPLALQTTANSLRDRLSADQDAARFLPLFHETIDFLARVHSSAQSEQKILEEFLGDLTGKLLELEERTLGVQALTRASAQGSSDLRSAFANHMANLKSSATNVNDIEQLRAAISHRLEIVSNYLKMDREAELARIKETERQVDQLTNRLHELEMETTELRSKLRVEHNMAMRDCLTGLPNRMAYEERIAQEMARWRRFSNPCCLLVWDVDHFKSINDRFGHKAGDKALVTIAQELSSSVRETDFVGRFGGEEFVMILSGSDKDSALKVANGIRSKIENCGFNSHGKPVKITISCGISQFLENDTHEHAFERADKALYQAKNDGRNRCMAI